MKRRLYNVKMNDDELFAKLSEAFEELYGPSESEDTSADSPFKRAPLDSFDDDDLDNLDNTIILNDENGNEVLFEFLDLIEYDCEEYVVLLPKDESDDAGEVVILKVDETDSDDEEAYTSVKDEETLQAVFNIFREKFKDEFNFED